MIVSEETKKAVREYFGTENFHPMNFYSDYIKRDSKEIKALATNFPEIPYRNKRIWLKEIINIIEKQN